MVLGWGNQIIAATIPEDCFFEWMGALSFFIASGLFFLAFLRSRKVKNQGKYFLVKQLVCLGLALMFFFGAGEEISWGQRILEIETPESIEAINDQEEITIHNLSFNGVNIPFEKIFDLFWMSFTVALPLAALLSQPFGRFVQQFVPLVPLGMGLLFVVNYLWAKVAKILYVSTYQFELIPFRQAVQEIKEGNYALLFVPVALFVFLEMSSLAQKQTTETLPN